MGAHRAACCMRLSRAGQVGQGQNDRGLENRPGLPNMQLVRPVPHSRSLESGNQVAGNSLTASRITHWFTEARILGRAGEQGLGVISYLHNLSNLL